MNTKIRKDEHGNHWYSPGFRLIWKIQTLSGRIFCNFRAKRSVCFALLKKKGKKRREKKATFCRSLDIIRNSSTCPRYSRQKLETKRHTVSKLCIENVASNDRQRNNLTERKVLGNWETTSERRTNFVTFNIPAETTVLDRSNRSVTFWYRAVTVFLVRRIKKFEYSISYMFSFRLFIEKHCHTSDTFARNILFCRMLRSYVNQPESKRIFILEN